MHLSHIRPAIAYGAICLLVLVLATAASPAHNGRRVRTGRPLLVALPQRLADVRDLAPGDRIERLVELRVRGKGRFAAVYLRTRVRRQSVLADPQRGLQIAIDRCSKRWQKRRGVYTCPGRHFLVLSQRALLRRARLRRLRLRPSHAAHLRLVLTLPAGADNQFQAETARVRYSFLGVVR